MHGSESYGAGVPTCTRRRILKSAGVVVAAVLPGTALAQRVMSPAVGDAVPSAAAPVKRSESLFRILASELNPDGAKMVQGVTVGGNLPGPELRVREGEVFRVLVDNRLGEQPTSIHWHGLLLPSAMDGVPGISQAPIPPGEFFLYEFPLRQSGTYWYHSHFGLQEQRGLFGPLIIEAKTDGVGYDQDFVLLLSDWLHANPADVIPNLRQPPGSGGREMKMGDGKSGAAQMGTVAAVDLSDVSYDAFLLNGRGPHDPWVGTAQAGDRIRLRVINAGASTIFRFGVDGQVLTVTHADGQPVQPVEVDNLLIGMGETYDVFVRLNVSGSFTVRGEAQNGSGQAIGILRTADTPAKATLSKPRWDGRMLSYSQLRSREPVQLPAPTRTFELPLDGRMADYVWTMGGQTWPEADPLIIAPGDEVLVELPNQTSMWHPMHLHGHFFRLLVEGVDPRFAPLKHTANAIPGETLRLQFVADNPGRWFFHCHNLYHLEAGMAREWIYRLPVG